MCLRTLLDDVLKDGDEGKPLNLEPVRRLVAALVRKCGRHDKQCCTVCGRLFWGRIPALAARRRGPRAGMGFRILCGAVVRSGR